MQPTLARLLPHHARYRPHAVALVFGGRRHTFREFNRLANRLAHAWLDAGLTRGDKVATVLPNCLELMTAYWAAAASGIVIVPCSTLLQQDGLRTLLNDSHSRMVIADPAHAAALAALARDLPAIAPDHFILTAATATAPHNFRTYADLTAGAAVTDLPADLRGDHPYNIMYSSGTTGAPKGIVHSHYTRSMYCTLFANAWRMTPESVVLHAGAIVFNGAMLDLMPWMYLGCRYLLHARFDPAHFLDTIATEGVTHVVLVPSQIIALLGLMDGREGRRGGRYHPSRLASLEMILSVGAPLHLAHKQRLNALLPERFYELYGVTEGFMTILDKRDAEAKAGSVGTPAAFTEVCILDEQDAPCPAGTVGEICGRGPLLMQGYYHQPEQTRTALRGGWLHSGDLGFMDEDGFLFIVERKKDMIISGGINVYPKDIEEVIIRHPQVIEVAVFGVPHPKWGEAPVAAVTTNGELSPADLVAWTNQRVAAHYQRLTAAHTIETFPRNVAGKILKRTLRARYGGEGEAAEIPKGVL